MYFDKINNLINKISIDLKERDEAIKMSILALLGGESIFLLGPPGVAKSLLSRKILSIVKDSNNFEYLMNRFSTPDEIFGPISIKKLEQDVYERKTEGYLPTAEIAFLDEIWKASPSIQNTLLTIINERIYMNGNNVEKVPLLLLIAASNELPASGEGLEALYDRFIIRLFIDNIMMKENFRYVIDTSSHEEVKISDNEKITKKDIIDIQEKSKSIKVDDNTFNFICDLKDKINSSLAKNAPYISDRRWKKIINLLKVSAVASDRNKIKPCDWLLVKNMIWETEDQQEKILPLFNEIWIDNVIKTSSSISITDANTMIEGLYDLFLKSTIQTKSIRNYKFQNQILYGLISDDDQNMILIERKIYEQLESKNFHSSYINYYYVDKSKKKNKSFTSLSNSNLYSSNLKINNEKSEVIISNKEYKLVNVIVTNFNSNELAKINEKNIEFLKSLNELKSSKEKLLKELNDDNSLLSSTYESQLKKLDNEIEKNFNSLYEKSSKLSGKISLLSDKEIEEIILDNSEKEQEENAILGEYNGTIY